MNEDSPKAAGPDPARFAETSLTGDKGLAAAVKAFSEFGWLATATTAAQDIGTDLLIAAHDRRFHRGEYLGAQVKSGDSYLGSPIADEHGKHVGWWVEVSAKHANYWIDNAIPHVLVLDDEETDVCHWVHLTVETIVTTGVGRKVQVPVHQTVVADQASQLLAVAATGRASVPLEGTAWTGAQPKSQTDHLRYALIAPRLLAPHPNSGATPKSPAEAVALLMQARDSQVWPPGSPHDDVPTRKEAATHELWGWRFVAALAKWLTSEVDPGFEELRREAKSVYERVAATAVIAHQRLAAGSPDEARDLVAREIGCDEAAPVDHAWLHLHLARSHQELGDLAEARRAATTSFTIGTSQGHDVTATAIRGIAAAILFDISPFSPEGDLASAIQYNDTAVAWWRAQTAYRGTAALVSSAFDRSVGHEPSNRDEVRANNELFAASVQAGVLGSQGQWRNISGLLARGVFLESRMADADDLSDGLTRLRRAGDETAVERATWWVTANGPGDAVVAACREIALARSTSSSIFADVAVLREAGDLLEPDVASAAADWLLNALDHPARLQALTHRMAFDHQEWIADKLQGIFEAIPVVGAEKSVDVLERFAVDFGVIAARKWARALAGIPRWAWTAEKANRLAAVLPKVEEKELAASIDYVGQAFDSVARDRLLNLVKAGEVWALDYIVDLHALHPSAIEEVWSILVSRIENDTAAERSGSLARGAARPLDNLLRVALAFPGNAPWEFIETAIADPGMPAWYKQLAITRVAEDHKSLDSGHRESVVAAIRAAGEAPPSERWGASDVDLTSVTSFALGVLADLPGQHLLRIGRLVSGSVSDRRWAARLAAEVGDVASLTILASDDSPFIRGEAAYGLAVAAAKDGGEPAILPTLRQVISDRGRVTGLGAARGIAEAAHSMTFHEVTELLADHPSAEVRRLLSADEHQDGAG